MRKSVIALLLALMVVSISILGSVEASGTPHWNSNNNVIETEDMVVMFKDRMPIYHIWIPEENETVVYIVKFNGLVEFEDTNGNWVYDKGVDRVVATAPFTAHVSWNISAEYINSSDLIELRITFSGSIPIQGTSGNTEENVNVTLINHIFNKDTDINGTPIEGGKELKIDVILGEYPWHSNTSLLALEIVYAGMFQGEMMTPHCEKNTYQHENRNAIRLQGDNADYGVEFRYEQKALVKENNTFREVDLNATDVITKSSAMTWITFPHYDDELVYDPSITILSTAESTGGLTEDLNSPILGVPMYVYIVAIVVIAAIVVGLRKIRG